MDDNNILVTIKKMIGLSPDDDSFDTDLVIDINSVLTILYQLGVSELDGIDEIIKDTTWTECFSEDISPKALNAIKTYIYLKVRKLFDPPQSSTTMESLTNLINEYEWRINALVDPAFEIKV